MSIKNKIRQRIPLGWYLAYKENRYRLFTPSSALRSQWRELYRANISGESLKICKPSMWENLLLSYIYCQPDRGRELAELFFSTEISISLPADVLPDEPLCLCVVRNDLIKIRNFISHHRNIGFRRFVVLDNMSTDGTREWLSSQPDVFLLTSPDTFSTLRREAWINRMIAFFGCRWYLVADSDELLDYEESATRPITDLIGVFENRGISVARALMLDMYADVAFYRNSQPEDYLSRCVYFDANTYLHNEWPYGYTLEGGPRRRVFGFNPRQSKMPLFRFDGHFIECDPHFQFPYGRNYGKEYNLVLRHYKFLPSDTEKYISRATEGNFFNGSEEYRKYAGILSADVPDFLSSESIRYSGPESLRLIEPYTAIKWD